MKFSMRVKLISIFAVFLVMLAGTAWGADPAYDVKVEPTLDNTKKILTLTFTFYKGEQKVDAFASLDNGWSDDFKTYLEPFIDIVGVSDSSLSHSNKAPSEAATYSIDKVIAKYTFDSELTSGNYVIRYKALWSSSAFYELEETNPTAALALEEKYGAFMDEHDAYYESKVVNGGQPVAIGTTGITVEVGTGAVSGNGALEAVTSGGKAKVSEIEKADVSSDTIMPLDVFKVTGQAKDSTFIQAYTMPLDTIAAGNHKVGDLVVVKLTKSNGPVKFTKAAPGSVENGQFSVTTFSGVPNDVDTIQSGVDYIISIGIKDGGPYDWDDAGGIIVDPAAIAVKSQGDNSSGGGCNAGGIGILGLLFAGLATRKFWKV